MSLEVRVNQYNDAEWEKFIENNPYHSLYCHLGWKKVIDSTFGHPTYYLAAIENNLISGVLPLVHLKSFVFGNFLISLPFFNYAGIHAKTEFIEKELVKKSIEIANAVGADYIELRHKEKYELGLPFKSSKVTFFLKLDNNPEVIWKSLDSKIRNQVRKAEKSDCKIEIGGREMIDDFYDVFCVNMRDLGTPVYSKDFFKNICEEFPNAVKIFIVKIGRRAVAGAFTLFHDGTLEIPWASSLRKYNKYCTNMFLYWEIIKYACLSNVAWFDFGRCSKDGSTYRFKKQWGAEERQLYWHYWTKEDTKRPEVNPHNPKYKILIWVWRRLPLWFTKLIGPCIVRNIP
jgi:FemAB-related protein (PEP-CTERM system-associated)